VYNTSEIDYLAIGCQKAEELYEIVSIISSGILSLVDIKLFLPLACDTEDFISPPLWQ